MVRIPDMNRDIANEILFAKTPNEILEVFSTPVNVPSNLIESYQKNGFEKFERIFSGNVLSYAKKIVEAAVFIRKEDDERELKDKSIYQQSFLQCGFLAFDFPAVKDLVFSIRLASVAKAFLNCNHVCLWHDQALFKEPNGRHTDVHVDSCYWPIREPINTGTIWLALNEASVEKGCLYFYPESQTYDREYIDIFNSPHQPNKIKEVEKVHCPLHPGDLTFHSGLTYHGAGVNNTNELREGMTIIYFADGCTYTDEDKRNATHKSCSGLKDGDVISTIYTSIIY